MDLSTPANLLIAAVYYVLTGVITFFSLFSVYTLIRYGKSQATALGAGALFTIIYLSILTSSYRTLADILR